MDETIQTILADVTSAGARNAVANADATASLRVVAEVPRVAVSTAGTWWRLQGLKTSQAGQSYPPSTPARVSWRSLGLCSDLTQVCQKKTWMCLMCF